MTETEQFLATMGRREDGEWKVVHRHANAAADPGEVVGRLALRP
jgi:ketosteroid isomerase-like protein